MEVIFELVIHYDIVNKLIVLVYCLFICLSLSCACHNYFKATKFGRITQLWKGFKVNPTYSEDRLS